MARAWASSGGRDYVTPDDVQDVASAVCGHRIALTPEAELRGANTLQVIAVLLDEVAVPRTREG